MNYLYFNLNPDKWGILNLIKYFYKLINYFVTFYFKIEKISIPIKCINV